VPAEASSQDLDVWLLVDDLGDDTIVITAKGIVTTGRAYDLWSACERALETADGRLVVCDLASVSEFDPYTLRALRCAAKVAGRLHLGFAAVMVPGGELEQFAYLVGLERVLAIFSSVAAAGRVALDPAGSAS
jgi:anti-anti-sigma regulatory factor